MRKGRIAGRSGRGSAALLALPAAVVASASCGDGSGTQDGFDGDARVEDRAGDDGAPDESTGDDWTAGDEAAEDAADTDVGPVESCAGRPDFTRCRVVTEPDLSYDICVGGSCVSPGTCGDAGCNAPGPHFPLPDTNQRRCYLGVVQDPLEETPCPGAPGDPACGATPDCGQDAQYGWDVGHAAAARFSVSAAVPDEPIVADNVTGLVWQGCSVGGQRGAGCAGDAAWATWEEALESCDELDWGGITDWRLPDDYELESILDYGTAAPTLDLEVFPNSPVEYAWTSSSWAQMPSLALAALLNTGDMHPDVMYKTEPGRVRCVTGGGTAEPARFGRTEPVAGQAVVADAVTGLLWQGCAAGQEGAGCAGEADFLDWTSGLAYCEGLSWGGHEDWRLPNVKELRSIVDNRRAAPPTIDVAAFPNTPWGRETEQQGSFWSSTTITWTLGVYAWARYVNFLWGMSHFYEKSEGRRVRCVRG
jgi:hypothetical protein